MSKQKRSSHEISNHAATLHTGLAASARRDLQHPDPKIRAEARRWLARFGAGCGGQMH